MMDLVKILNGIQHFYEIIIPKAFQSGDWDEKSINTAFQWVKFCEEAYAKCSGKNAEKLDTFLHSVSNELKHIYKTSLCIQDLQYSSTLLTQAFFENPNLERGTIEEILHKSPQNSNVFSENLQDVLLLDSLCYNLVESLRNVSIINSPRMFYYEVKSELFLDFLKSNIEHQPTDIQEPQLTSAFDTLCENEENMMIYFHALMYSKDKEDNEIVEIQEFGMSSLLLKLYCDSNTRLSSFLWKQSPRMLRILALKYESFYGYYMDFIIKSTNSLKKIEQDGIFSWKTRESTNQLTLSFDQICKHIQSILSVNDDVRKSFLVNRSSFVDAHPDDLVWKEILS